MLATVLRPVLGPVGAEPARSAHPKPARRPLGRLVRPLVEATAEIASLCVFVAMIGMWALLATGGA